MATEPNVVLKRDWLQDLGSCECCGEHLAQARVVSVSIALQCQICEHTYEITWQAPDSVLDGPRSNHDALGCCPSCYECRLIPIKIE
jgi:hypothetical protein